MRTEQAGAIRVVRPDDVVWGEASRGPEETEPAGSQCTAFEAGAFRTGLWQRDVQCRSFERPHHEIAYIIEGEVEITCEDGQVVKAGPGDVLITPKGSKGYWRNVAPVKKFWAVFEE
jgi:uncharacterized cupin superfamily protein